MHKFAITTDIKDEQSFSVFGDISLDLGRLQTEAGAFVILEASPPINFANYIQVASTSYKKGFFKNRHKINRYTIEINITDSQGDLKQYECETGDLDEVIKILDEYVTLCKIPDISAWVCISKVLHGKS